MEKYDVELLPAAYADLDEIFDYIIEDSMRIQFGKIHYIDNILIEIQKLRLLYILITCRVKNIE